MLIIILLNRKDAASKAKATLEISSEHREQQCKYCENQNNGLQIKKHW